MTTKIKHRGHRGYATTARNVSQLVAALTERGIDSQVTDDLGQLGKYPRPIFVADHRFTKPNGWVWYGTCQYCGKPSHMNDSGLLTSYGCGQPYRPIMDYWRVLEMNTPVTILADFGLPELFINQLDVRSVADVRIRLNDRNLKYVGAEREIQVSLALQQWREEVLKQLG